MSLSRLLATAIALAGSVQPTFAQTAQLAKPCVSEQEVSALAIYAAPSLIQGVTTRCGSNLAADGFLATQGPALAARYEKRQVEVWPAAKGAMLKLIDKPEEANLIRALPDNAVRPLFGAVVSQLLVKDIKPIDCSKIEHGIKILAPLPVESVGEITGFILAMASKDKGPQVCPFVDAARSGKANG